VAESVPGYDVRGWFGMFAPARVSPEVLAKLNGEAKRALQAPDVIRRINAEGAEVVASSPQDFAAEVKTEYAKWRELVKRPGMKF
jgi:tripartite-type tricarboxylate transporter receptor subunit TctC